MRKFGRILGKVIGGIALMVLVSLDAEPGVDVEHSSVAVDLFAGLCGMFGVDESMSEPLKPGCNSRVDRNKW